MHDDRQIAQGRRLNFSVQTAPTAEHSLFANQYLPVGRDLPQAVRFQVPRGKAELHLI